MRDRLVPTFRPVEGCIQAHKSERTPAYRMADTVRPTLGIVIAAPLGERPRRSTAGPLQKPLRIWRKPTPVTRGLELALPVPLFMVRGDTFSPPPRATPNRNCPYLRGAGRSLRAFAAVTLAS